MKIKNIIQHIMKGLVALAIIALVGFVSFLSINSQIRMQNTLNSTQGSSWMAQYSSSMGTDMDMDVLNDFR